MRCAMIALPEDAVRSPNGWVGICHGHITCHDAWHVHPRGMGMHTWSLSATGWLGGQRGHRQGGRHDRLARGGATVDAGTAGRGSRAARVVQPKFRGLPQVCHASGSGFELRHLGFVMLGSHDLRNMLCFPHFTPPHKMEYYNVYGI